MVLIAMLQPQRYKNISNSKAMKRFLLTEYMLLQHKVKRMENEINLILNDF